MKMTVAESIPDMGVPTGSPPRGGDLAVYVFDINQPSLPTPFYAIFVSVSVFAALSSAFWHKPTELAHYFLCYSCVC